MNDPDEAIALFEWADEGDSRAFFASEELRERLEEAGVNGRPELTELEFIDQKPTRHPSARIRRRMHLRSRSTPGSLYAERARPGGFNSAHGVITRFV